MAENILRDAFTWTNTINKKKVGFKCRYLSNKLSLLMCRSVPSAAVGHVEETSSLTHTLAKRNKFLDGNAEKI